MEFGNLNYLWVLWLLPLVAIFYLWAFKRKRRLLERFVSAELRDRLLHGFSAQRQHLKAILIVLALLFTVLALIRPKYGFHWEEVKRKGVDIVIAIDVSQSMLAEDVSPNRLERAKREIIDLVSLVEGDRIGLVAFAGTSFLQCPLTLDYGAVQIFLDELDTELIPVPGTAIAEAITKSISAFDEQDKNARVVILITDGEDHLGQPLAAAEEAKRQNVRIYAIGIGKEGGVPIPNTVNGGFKKDRRGNVIMTKLDATILRKIALTTGGSYVRSVTGNLDLEMIYADIRASVESKELQSGRRKRFEERYQWPLMVALLLLLMEGVVREKPAGRGFRLFARLYDSRKLYKSKVAIAVVFGLAAFTLATPELHAAKAHQGEQAYNQENWPRALHDFLDAQVEDPDNLNLMYNLGNTYYKTGDYQKAARMFADTAANGQPDLAQKSYYNLGNVAYRRGKLQEAIQFFDRALQMDPEDQDAKYNLDFVKEEKKRRAEEQNRGQQNKQQQDRRQQDQQQQDQQQTAEDRQTKQDQKNGQTAQRDSGDKEPNKQGEHDQRDTATGDGDRPEQQDQQAHAAVQRGPNEQMSREEAQRWLATLNNDRKQYLKRKFGQQRRYKVEKDW